MLSVRRDVAVTCHSHSHSDLALFSVVNGAHRVGSAIGQVGESQRSKRITRDGLFHC
ncbi:unnamed protein product [Toxocara canis]|uniref:Uncharacterized protein n=1 Tax=Toxocara canis TaxID=6265 RepID=A0A183UFF1_TOXCA|nr:unnamed protein product [Toxocara canis]